MKEENDTKNKYKEDEELLRILEKIYKISDEYIEKLKNFIKQGNLLIQKINDCIYWIKVYIYTKTGILIFYIRLI
jgi:hypothetical protein